MPVLNTCKANVDSFVGHRVKIYPNEEQKEKINKYIRFYRWVYNWALETTNEIYKETGEFTRDFAMWYIYKERVRNNPEYEWIHDFPAAIAKDALRSAMKSFINFFEHRTRYPKFKSAKRSSLSYGVRGERVYFRKNGYVGIEGMGKGLCNYIYCGKIAEEFAGKRIYSARVTFDKDDYWLSFQVETQRQFILDTEQTDVIGIDVGAKHLATLSDGTVYDSPKNNYLRKRYRKLCKQTGKHYRKMLDESMRTRTKFHDIEKSKNLLKLEAKLRKTKRRMSHIQNTFVHTITKEIVNKNPKAICVESLDVLDLIKTRDKNGNKKMDYKLRAELVTSQLSVFFHALEYKAAERNIPYIKADPYFPSTQICSNCGHRQKIGTNRVYVCPECGMSLDRDVNAAINLKNYAISKLY